jgi:hypothetical protein
VQLPPHALPSLAHCVRLPCGLPEATSVHVPSKPLMSHALHGSPQAESQQ